MPDQRQRITARLTTVIDLSYDGGGALVYGQCREFCLNILAPKQIDRARLDGRSKRGDAAICCGPASPGMQTTVDEDQPQPRCLDRRSAVGGDELGRDREVEQLLDVLVGDLVDFVGRDAVEDILGGQLRLRERGVGVRVVGLPQGCASSRIPRHRVTQFSPGILGAAVRGGAGRSVCTSARGCRSCPLKG